MRENPGRQEPQVVLITGASSGIGLECAQHLAARGHTVYGTSRTPSPRGEFTMLQMDVTDDQSVARAVETIIAAESRLDVVVNNAGFGIAGPIESTSAAEARAQFETNVLGPLRVCTAVLPHMRRQRAGLIVNIGSIAGLVPLPFQGLYSASKFALEAITESLRMEVQPFGIRVAIVEPGDFRTSFTSSRRFVEAAGDAAYEERFRRAMAVVERDEGAAPPPVMIARQVERIMHAGSPRLRYRVGGLLQRLAPTLRHLLPYPAYERLLMDTYDVRR